MKFFQVDAFTKVPFGGNPGAVVLVESKMSDDLMQKIALENNLSETGYIEYVYEKDPSFSSSSKFKFRWFTPICEGI